MESHALPGHVAAALGIHEIKALNLGVLHCVIQGPLAVAELHSIVWQRVSAAVLLEPPLASLTRYPVVYLFRLFALT